METSKTKKESTSSKSKTATSKKTASKSAKSKSSTASTKKTKSTAAVKKNSVTTKKATPKSVASSSKTEDNSKVAIEKKSIDILKKNPVVEETHEKGLSHVEILQKKIEAQKKLKEELLEEEKNPQVQLREKLEASIEQNLFIEEEATEEEMDSEIIRLKQINEDLLKQLNELKEDSESKDEKISILTSSIVTKTNESELIKQIEALKQQNALLQDELSKKKTEVETQEKEKPEKKKELNDKYLLNIREKGDVVLRIKLINERIAEKDAQINLVEEELNKLTEKDIIAQSFTDQIKNTRKLRSEAVNQANYELEGQAKLIKINEEKMQNKKAMFVTKSKELEDFNKSLSKRKLTYSEKEEELKTRSKLTAEKDALYIEVENLEENYKKLVARYKVTLDQAEKRVEKLSKFETDLIELYLKQLRDKKTIENEDYQNQKEEREVLLSELNNLYKKLEDEKKVTPASGLDDLESLDLDKVKNERAKSLGKLALIKQRLEERANVEKTLLIHEDSVKQYYDAFKMREIVSFNINENEGRINTLTEKIASEPDTKVQDSYKAKISSLEILIEDDKRKLNYYEDRISKYIDDEKVIFYMQLISSMVELKDAEEEYTKKVSILKDIINRREYI